MSDARPQTPEELHMLAGEYVLGVLGGTEMRAVDRTATADPQLARAIAGWERRFAPMLTAVVEVAPPEALWARIEHAKAQVPGQREGGRPPVRLAPVPSAPMPSMAARPAAPRRVWPWKLATGVSLALAAALAAFVLMPSLAQGLHQPMMGGREVALVAVLTQPESPGATRQDAAPQMASDTGIGKLVEPQADAAEPVRAAAHVAGFFAATWPDGTVVLTAFAPVPVPAGKTLELWIEPPDATVPKSLGVVPASGLRAVLPGMPAAGTALSVSVEPIGGSRTGAPTGRVLYAGTLRPAGR